MFAAHESFVYRSRFAALTVRILEALTSLAPRDARDRI